MLVLVCSVVTKCGYELCATAFALLFHNLFEYVLYFADDFHLYHLVLKTFHYYCVIFYQTHTNITIPPPPSLSISFCQCLRLCFFHYNNDNGLYKTTPLDDFRRVVCWLILCCFLPLPLSLHFA